MAEAVVEDRPGPPQRFYCHVCKQEFTDITQDYTCPVCSDGFIEELHDADPSPSSGPSNSMEVDVLELLNTGLREGLAGDRSRGSNRRPPRPPYQHHHHHHHHHHHGNAPVPGAINSYDQFFRDFFAFVGVPTGGVRSPGRQLLAGAGGPGGRADVTLTPMFFVGNPGDYVWGHDGLDSVITLMLNQLEPSGPPPMSAQKIDEIPKCEIGQDELDKKMQCSVCLEDFQLQEQCRKLPCAHIFHETCILPWLELHGTCPICRDTFTEPETEESAQEQDETMDTDAPSTMSTGTSTNSFESFLSDIQRPGGVMDVLASHLPRSLTNPSGSSARGSSSTAGAAGVIGDSAPNSQTVSSSSLRNNAISSQSGLASSGAATSTTTASSPSTNNANEANANNNVPSSSNNLNFHLDDGLD